MPGKKGNYSNIIIYDERKRYYYLWAQKNRPILDDEVRAINTALLDQVRRSVQNIYGDVAAPLKKHSGFVSTEEAFKVKESSTDKNKNFTVTGGTSLDHPAILYIKGFYAFFTGDIDYKSQMYTSDNIDLNNAPDKYKTLTPIPALTTPSSDRTDIVYLHLHFEEVSAETGTYDDIYRDSNLKNPIVGTETAHRLRAVFDIRVKEGWADPIDENIFIHNDFLGGISPNDFDPTNNEYKVPIAVIYRKAFQDQINDSEIVDLLTIYNKRACTLEELTYRLKHGGYTQQDVDESGLSGFQPQFPFAKVDEGAFATGLNKGIDTEAFNTNSVTPRVLDNTGKYFMDGLMVGHDTGIVTYETGPVSLETGEVVGQKGSLRNLQVGFGLDGVTGIREYKHTVDIVSKGETGRATLNVSNIEGETGSQAAVIKSVQEGKIQNFFYVDYKGRVGLNKFTPGWDQPRGEWNTDRYNDGLFGEPGVNILLDIEGSVRISDHLFVEKDLYVHRDMFGRTWKIPGLLSEDQPALFGFTGIPQDHGFTGAVALALYKRGIGVVGETGLEGHGYTGLQSGQYEAYTPDGERVFTIGDVGEDYDRVVKTLYGTSTRFALISDNSFLDLPSGLGGVQIGDTVSYDIVLANGNHVTGSLVLTNSAMSGVEEIRDDILANPDFPNGYQRTFSYTFYNTDGSTEIKTGTAYGVQIVEDEFGYALSFDNHGRLILKDMPESPVEVELDSVAYFRVARPLNPTVDVSFTSFHLMGSSDYGGVLRDIKFAKLDLGPAVDAWLFEGDVFFNGNGIQNRVTFSPNVIFRDDVFVYGTLYAENVIYNFANIHNMVVRNNLFVEKNAQIKDKLAVGDNALNDLESTTGIIHYTKGTAWIHELLLQTSDPSSHDVGSLFFKTPANNGKAYVALSGSVAPGSTNPFGIHLIDKRPGIDFDSDQSFKDLVLDYSDGDGNFGSINLIINGDLTLNRGLISKYLACGNVTAINTDFDFAFYCNGRAQINDVLEVKALRFIGAEAPEGQTDIVTPSNVSIIDNDTEEAHNNENILREKKFTVTEKIYLNNQDKLGLSSYTDAQDYYDQIDEGEKGFWAFDTLTYSENDFDTLYDEGDPGNTTENEIIVQNVADDIYKRYNFRRSIIATIGTLNIEWTGYAYDPSGVITGVIQEYYLESPYFRNRDGGTVIDWMPGENRFGDDNLLVRVTGDLIDDHPSDPNIYGMDQVLSIYIPRDKWFFADYEILGITPRQLETGYRSFMLFYPYENIISNLNLVDFNKKRAGYSGYDAEWQIALYPRLVKQRRLPFDQTTGSNVERMYQGEWDLDLVIYPKNIGRCANMIGKLYISYMQA